MFNIRRQCMRCLHYVDQGNKNLPEEWFEWGYVSSKGTGKPVERMTEMEDGSTWYMRYSE